jgi:hypothetical protein
LVFRAHAETSPNFRRLLVSSQLALAQFTQQGPKLVGTDAVGDLVYKNSLRAGAKVDKALPRRLKCVSG